MEVWRSAIEQNVLGLIFETPEFSLSDLEINWEIFAAIRFDFKTVDYLRGIKYFTFTF